MWRGVQANAIAGSTQHGFKEDAGRALAIGATNREYRHIEMQIHGAAHCLDPLQAHGNASGCSRMSLFDIGQPLR